MDNLSPALVLGRVVEAEGTVEGLKARLQRLDRPAGIETDWLPIASPMAGPEAGFVFTPEVDDLAVLGFVGKKGIILGFIFGGTTTPPTDAPEERKIASRDGNALILIDGDDSGITHSDSNGNEVLMNADGIKLTDANGNEIVMDAGGITMTTSGDFKIEAAGTTTIIGATVELNP
jgi:uncharacterized protein involved in type VI secretion and phage assembly